MDVVKEEMCERAVHLGRVRMTYLLVTEPGMSMDGSGQHQRSQEVESVNTKT